MLSFYQRFMNMFSQLYESLIIPARLGHTLYNEVIHSSPFEPYRFMVPAAFQQLLIPIHS